MTQYNILNVNLTNLQLNNLKCAIKKWYWSNVTGDSNDENNFSHKSLLINTKVSKLSKAFGNKSSANMKLSKTQLH